MLLYKKVGVLLDRQKAKAAGGRSISCVGCFPSLIRWLLVSTLDVRLIDSACSEVKQTITLDS